ncbi:MAG: xylulokinase [Ilumatobacteraceae bacterium]
MDLAGSRRAAVCSNKGDLNVGDGCVLAIDLGTGGPKVALVDTQGRTLAWRNAPVATTILDGGGAEQDPHQMWSALVAACRATVAAVQPLPPLLAVAVTSQYMSLVPIARDGTPTGPSINWMDSRGAAGNLELLTDETFMMFLERHGIIPLPSGHDNVAHARVLRQFHPDAYDAAAALVEPMDYLTARLTGRITSTQSTSFSFLSVDNRTWGAVEHSDDLLTASRLDPSKVAPLVPMSGVIGELLPSVAAELGVPAGIPVVPGTIDSITSAVGTGALTPADAAVVIGTTAVIVTHIPDHRSNLEASLVSVPSPVPGMYYVMAENGIGGRAFEWAQHFLGYASAEAAFADAAEVPVGSGGVGFLPWLIGSMAPSMNDDIRGAFVGLGLEHDRRHAIRAAAEGVALNLAWLRPVVESFTGRAVTHVPFGGGGASSPLWAQILSEAMGVPVHRLAEPRATNARGAAFLALADLGLISLGDVPGLLEVAQVHEPTDQGRVVMGQGLARLAAMHGALVAQTAAG